MDELKKRAVYWMDKSVDAVFHLAVAASILIFLSVCAAIFSRYILGRPLNWTPGIVTLLSDWAVFLMAGVYLYRNDDIVIPYFYDKFIPERMKPAVDIIVTLLTAALALVMVKACWGAMKMGDYLASISTIPIHYYWFTMPFFIAMIMAMIGAFRRVFMQTVPWGLGNRR